CSTHIVRSHPCLCLSRGSAPTDLYPLSLHDALPILRGDRPSRRRLRLPRSCDERPVALDGRPGGTVFEQIALVKQQDALEAQKRSEEHTSELQSRENLVCRLLLEKKNFTARAGTRWA